MSNEERYQELLDLLSRGLIRYAEKHGLLERMPVDSGEVEITDSLEWEGLDND